MVECQFGYGKISAERLLGKNEAIVGPRDDSSDRD